MSTEFGLHIFLDWIFISSCRKLSSGLCHNSNNTQWWLGFLFLRGETESVLRVISSSRNGSELKRPMAHKVCKRTKIHIRDCKSYPTKDWCVSMVAKKVAAQTYCHSWVETVQDFLIKLGIKPLMHLLEINTFSLNNVIVRLTKIMNRADKNWAHF